MKTNVKKLTRLALLCAAAIALSAFEGLFTPLLPPGAKAGLSNVVVMLAASTMGWLPTLTVVLFKAVFALLSRGAVSAAFSALGGLCSAILLLFLFRYGKLLGVFGISLLGAFTHSAAQLLLSYALYGAAIFAYAPVFLLLSVPSGLITAAALRATLALSSRRQHQGKERKI
ncbi:MAG: Gx transporter family protein [Clostridia bacterium]|nr:Gx transporter family protein [Clostridia bacterium]